jgi:hypothetical protein
MYNYAQWCSFLPFLHSVVHNDGLRDFLMSESSSLILGYIFPIGLHPGMFVCPFSFLVLMISLVLSTCVYQCKCTAINQRLYNPVSLFLSKRCQNVSESLRPSRRPISVSSFFQLLSFLASYRTLAFRTTPPAKRREDILSPAPHVFRVLSGLGKVIAVSYSLWYWWCVCST